jgi:hypothetical protein
MDYESKSTKIRNMTAKPIRVVPINGTNVNQLQKPQIERPNPIQYFSV